VFRSRFLTWDDVIQVDHRAADLVQVEQLRCAKAAKLQQRPGLQRMLGVKGSFLSVSPSTPLPQGSGSGVAQTNVFKTPLQQVLPRELGYKPVW